MNVVGIVKEELRGHEGLRLKMYKDSRGVWTIGYGLNLEAGIDKQEAEWLLEHRVMIALGAATRLVRAFEKLPLVVQTIVINMAYNLGETKLGKFRRMLKALDERDFKEAAAEGRASDWFDQVGARAEELMRRLGDA